MHPWHDIELGKGFPEIIPAVIEIPFGSKLKLAVDKKTGMLRLKQLLVTASRYPFMYGFVPRTLGSDGDALDLIILFYEPVPPLTLMKVRPIGGVELVYPDKGAEEKLIAVEASDPQYEGIDSLKKLPEYRLKELEQFFETYKTIEGKKVEIKKLFGRSHARKALVKAMERYRRDPIAA